MVYIEQAMKFSLHYDEKTLAHAMRVAAYVADSPFIAEENQGFAIALAILHDLIEDTRVELVNIKFEELRQGLAYLTKRESESYVDYCFRIKQGLTEGWIGQCAYVVKLADMKDHLSLTETLTDKLKAKYLEGLAVLL